jgi:hypothetical protein
MKNFLLIFCILVLVSCGKAGKDGVDGISAPVALGPDKILTGIDFEDIDPGLVCANGGVSIFTFQDENTDGLFQIGESVLKVKAICNGIDGTNASLTIENIASSVSCPSGGVKVSGGSLSPVEVCHGVNGLNGLNGANGTIVQPVKFCSTDNSAFPEYGVMIGDELFAVYWGTTPGSPSTSQAFLTKLVAGNYRSTGGNNCLFSIE